MVKIMKGQLRQAKTFSVSKLSKGASVPYLLTASIKSIFHLILFPILLCIIKPTSSLCMMEGKIAFNLSVSDLVKIFRSEYIKTSPIQKIFAQLWTDHNLGVQHGVRYRVPFKNTFKREVKWDNRVEENVLKYKQHVKYKYVNLSHPTALLFVSFLIVLRICPGVIRISKKQPLHGYIQKCVYSPSTYEYIC